MLTSIVYAFDNPRQGHHILLDDEEKRERRQKGNSLMMEVALDVVGGFGSK